MVAAESGGGWRRHRRCQLPGSVRARRHDRAAIRGLRRVLSLDFQTGISGWRLESLSLGEGARPIRRWPALAPALSAAG